jgi:hypothetical protein
MITEMENVTTVQQLQDKRNLPVNEEVAFTNHKGIYKSTIARRQQKMLEKVDFIKPFLEQDEEILVVTQGCSPILPLEHLLTGWVIIYLKKALFILTNKRIFHVPASDLKYKNKIAQIRYGDCREMKMSFGSLKVKYWNNESETFMIHGPERKKIKSLLKEMPLEGFHSQARCRVHLCPNCTNELIHGRYVCDICGLQFKNEKKGRCLSLFCPGGGYFYIGHYFFGISDAIVETSLSAMLIISLLDGFRGVIEGFIGAFAFGLVLLIEKTITIFHTKQFIREFIPEIEITNTEKIENFGEDVEPENEYQQQAAMLDFRTH